MILFIPFSFLQFLCGHSLVCISIDPENPTYVIAYPLVMQWPVNKNQQISGNKSEQNDGYQTDLRVLHTLVHPLTYSFSQYRIIKTYSATITEKSQEKGHFGHLKSMLSTEDSSWKRVPF